MDEINMRVKFSAVIETFYSNCFGPTSDILI